MAKQPVQKPDRDHFEKGQVGGMRNPPPPPPKRTVTQSPTPSKKG